MTYPRSCTAFDGSRRMAQGAAADVARAIRTHLDQGGSDSVLVFDDADGKPVDFDLRGTPDDVAVRHSAAPEPPRGRGRPKLGVMAREVTLLPRHWEWLAAQPGGASVALRKLVETARASGSDRRRHAQEAAYRVMTALAGNAPGYEEAIRALFARERAAFERQVKSWPADVRAYVTALAGDTF